MRSFLGRYPPTAVSSGSRVKIQLIKAVSFFANAIVFRAISTDGSSVGILVKIELEKAVAPSGYGISFMGIPASGGFVGNKVRNQLSETSSLIQNGHAPESHFLSLFREVVANGGVVRKYGRKCNLEKQYHCWGMGSD